MVRIAVSVEGQTEERFIKIVLAPYLQSKGVYLFPVLLGKGGCVNIDRVSHELQKLAHNFDKVTMLYDFYGFSKKAPDETKTSLEKKIHNRVPKAIQKKLIPYIQMYEFESLLFSCPQSMAAILNGNRRNIQSWAEDILKVFDNKPENINDSPQTAPSKRLKKKTNYRKTIHGPNIAKKAGIDKIRTLCPEFNAWITQLEALQ